LNSFKQDFYVILQLEPAVVWSDTDLADSIRISTVLSRGLDPGLPLRPTADRLNRYFHVGEATK